MSILREFVLRYRTTGHVRFEIPVQLCEKTVANTLTATILTIEGVYSANLFRRQKKLSVRFDETFCDFNQLTKQLAQLIATLDKNGALQPKTPIKTKQKRQTGHKLKDLKAAKWANEKYVEIKETLQAAKVLTKMGLKKPSALVKDPEKAIINFLNDILVLYLIKVHWSRITQEWLPHPFRHRYEWATVFYLMYLLMRSKKPK